jgi:hypothetical protein
MLEMRVGAQSDARGSADENRVATSVALGIYLKSNVDDQRARGVVRVPEK